MWRKVINLNKQSIPKNNLNLNKYLNLIKTRDLSNDNNEKKKLNNDSIIELSSAQNVNKSENKNENENLLNLIKDSANFNEITNNNWSTTPYNSAGEKIALLCNNNKKNKIKINPTDTTIFMFPGQGTLKIGAIKKYLHYPRVKELFDISNQVLGYDILNICLNGPQDKLNKTEYNQVATILTSLSALEKIWEETPLAVDNCKAALGYSVGELTALIFSGALTIEDGIRLAGIRGAAMQYASDQEPNQGMLTVVSKSRVNINKACKDATDWAINMGISLPVCQIAIYLCNQTRVLAGHEKSLEYIINNNKNYKINIIKRLSVSGAFHTPLMKPALKSYIKALNEIEIQEPRVTVYSNITAEPYKSCNQIRKSLPKQIISPVKWEQILHSVYKRPHGNTFPRTFDLGSNGTMKTILEKNNFAAADSCTTV